MKRNVALSWLVGFLLFSSYSYKNASAQVVFWGDTCVEKSIKVFVTTDSTKTDLNVFEVDSVTKILADGQFYRTLDKDEATYYMIEVAHISDADLIIRFVASRDCVGWVKKAKRYLFVVRKYK